MSSIKPPDGRSPAGPIGPAADRSAPTDAERVGPSFRETLAAGPDAAAGAPKLTGQASAGAISKTDAVAELAQAVRTGSLNAEQAIERLVEHAVGGMGRALSAAQRAELTAVLREAVQNDPALRQLRESLG